MINVLFCNPNLFHIPLYIPYVYGLLRGSCDENPQLKKEINWLMPVYHNSDVNNLLSPYKLENIDVLALSCFTWNRCLNYEIAKQVKHINPNCIVVVGGPEPDYKNQNFFKINPFIDIVVKQEGEYSFPKIVLEIVNGTYDFSNISGLVIKNFGDTGRPILKTKFDKSYYLEYSDIFSLIAKDIRDNGGNPVMILESDRGCPYGCTFCDWGSFTLQKIRKIPLEYVNADIEWGAKVGIHWIEIVNANFGIFDRDVDIANKIAQVKKATTYPNMVFYSATKSKTQNTVEIIITLKNADLLQHHTLAIQSTDLEVLAAVKRKNLPYKENLKLAKTVAEYDIPSSPQIIVGQPGDTYEKYKKTFFDMMNGGFYDSYMVFPFQILPNAPANEKAYKEEWEIETITRHNCRQRRKIKHKTTCTSLTEYIVKTKTYNREDYINMLEFGATMIAFSGSGLTRLIAGYLKLTHNIPLDEFYFGFLNDFCHNSKYKTIQGIYTKLHKNQHNIVFSEDSFYEFEHEELPEYHAMFDSEEYILISVLLNFKAFREEFEDYIRTTYQHIAIIESILQFQMDFVITLDYNYNEGVDITTNHNWITYFKTAKINWWSKIMQEPLKEFNVKYIKQKECGPNSEWKFSWLDHKDEKRKETFIENVVGTVFKRTDRNLFKL